MNWFDYGGGYYAQLGFQEDHTEKTNSQVNGAVNERQSIVIGSVYKWEKQVTYSLFKN